MTSRLELELAFDAFVQQQELLRLWMGETCVVHWLRPADQSEWPRAAYHVDGPNHSCPHSTRIPLPACGVLVN